MANIGTSIAAWSTTEASNQPDGTDSATIAGDLRAIQAGVRYLRTNDTIASASTCDLGSNDAEYLSISGVTTITALGTVSAGIVKRVAFEGALTLTHNGTSLILPGAANITTAAGDTAEFVSLGSGNWRCTDYQKASGAPAVGFSLTDGDKGDITVATSGTAWTIDAGFVTGKTEDTAPDGEADYLLSYDNSATALKKILLNKATAFSMVSFTRNLTTASGTQAVTGAGFKPKAVIFISAISAAGSASWGFDNGTTAMCTFFGSTTYDSAATYSMMGYASGGNYQTGVISSLDADGFTVTWTKVGSPTGTNKVYAFCLR